MKLPGPAWAGDFLRFGVVGTVGFAVSVGIVYAVRGFMNLYAAGVLAWIVSVTVTWWLNRSWTFKGRGTASVHEQWMRFISVSLLGFALNFGTYAFLISRFPICASQPVIAVVGGVLVGMGSNFTLSRRLVFR